MEKMHGTGRRAGRISVLDLDTMRGWARGLRPLCEALEAEGGPPAIWTAGQACHESYSRGGPSKLAAAPHYNLWGIKWAEWQREFGCKPVTMDTFEYIDGQRVDLSDAFCSMPTLEVAFEVYGHLLGFPRYADAKRWRHDPLLYGLEVWRSGWATNPTYITGLWGVPFWLKVLAADFAPVPVPIKLDNGVTLEGWLQDAKTVAYVRPLLEALGLEVYWVTGTVMVNGKGALIDG